MTTVYCWRWFEAYYLAKESVASITAFPSKDGDHPTQIFTARVLRRFLAGNPRYGMALVPEAG
jgi:hypothetical protein